MKRRDRIRVVVRSLALLLEVVLVLVLALSACDSGSVPEDMSTSSDPAAYCQSHPDAMPDCTDLDLDACEAHPFCDPFDAIPCAGDGPEDWVETKISCMMTEWCNGTELDATLCTLEITFARASGAEGSWFLFYNACIPDGWVSAEELEGSRFGDACEMMAQWYFH